MGLDLAYTVSGIKIGDAQQRTEETPTDPPVASGEYPIDESVIDGTKALRLGVNYIILNLRVALD